jgi:triphosphoribosyl-dephospho-CoA synthase
LRGKKLDSKYVPWKICSLGQLAILLEASSPKPGNVNRIQSFSDTSYRHFLASASLLNKGLFDSSVTGWRLGLDEIEADEVELGKLIHESSELVFGGPNLSNTIMGTILLYVPLAVAISSAISESGRFDVQSIQSWMKKIVDSTTVEDSLEVYNALKKVHHSGEKHKSAPRWNEFHARFDINNANVFDNIREDQISLGDLFRSSAEVDPICEEWSTYFNLILNEILPRLQSQSQSLDDIEEAIVKSFVWLLAKKPDGLIIKKAGWETARKIQELAQSALAERNESDLKGIMNDLDGILRRHGNIMNPGSTADFISAGVFSKLVQNAFND